MYKSDDGDNDSNKYVNCVSVILPTIMNVARPVFWLAFIFYTPHYIFSLTLMVVYSVAHSCPITIPSAVLSV